MNLAAALSFACGFASLSLEILWVRLYGFAKSSTPAAFGFVLCLYLVGIALGAALGARACRAARDERTLWRASIVALLASGMLSPLLAALFAWAGSTGFQHPLVDLATIPLASAVLSFVFPIAHHLGTAHQGQARGRHFARVYTANVAGAALGPLVTGYVLLDAFSLQTCFLLLGAFQVTAAVLLRRAVRLPGRVRGFGVAAALAGAGLVAAAATLDPHMLLRHFPAHQPGAPAQAVLENRHGVITIFAGEHGDDTVFGGNVYDGSTNLDPERNTNGLERPLMAMALHPSPKRVLMAGLSIGTWLAVVREFPGVEAIDVVEINPGYLRALEAYPPQARALHDPRVNLVVDDARRWLRHHPQRQYDLIIMNTTLHWRANASLLLSQELMRAMRSHMAPGAILAFNATGSPDAFQTAAATFPHAYAYSNFVFASDRDFRAEKSSERLRTTLRELKLDGGRFFVSGSRAPESFVAVPLRTIADEQRIRPRALEVVTDDNMLTEFRYGRPLYFWTDLFAAPGS